jgi:hypothetical protein
LQGFLVALHTDHADLGRWDHVEHPGEHAQPGTQDRHDGDFLALDLLHLERPGPAGDALGNRFQILGRFVGEQGAHFAGQLAEFLGADTSAAHQSQLVLDQRMTDFNDFHAWLPGGSASDVPQQPAAYPTGLARVQRRQARLMRGQLPCSTTLQATAHEGLARGTLECLGPGLGVAAFHAVALR